MVGCAAYFADTGNGAADARSVVFTERIDGALDLLTAEPVLPPVDGGTVYTNALEVDTRLHYAVV